jgi:hypothetical protein
LLGKVKQKVAPLLRSPRAIIVPAKPPRNPPSHALKKAAGKNKNQT